jgi:Secretion system C-terminal sorting domain/Lectin C-type domain
MKKTIYILLVLVAKVTLAQTTCYTASNSIAFNYSGHSYKIIKELKNWSNAATCAVSDGGYLVEIGNLSEQTAIYNALTTSGISTTYKAISDGGGTSYVWIGAADITTEGTWLWDGDNNGVGINFWNGQGTAGTGTGTVVAGAYNNWGQTNGTGTNNEPDDYLSNQDGGAIALAGWPSGGSSYGAPGQWNDINKTNTCYYIIEYNTILTTVLEQTIESQISLFPNPVKDIVEIQTILDIKELTLLSIDGKLIKILIPSKTIDLTGVSKGIYFIQITTTDNKIVTKKIVKD